MLQTPHILIVADENYPKLMSILGQVKNARFSYHNGAFLFTIQILKKGNDRRKRK